MEYIVRIAIDLKVQAESEEEARTLADKHKITPQKDTEKVEYYDSQVYRIWTRQELD